MTVCPRRERTVQSANPTLESELATSLGKIFYGIVLCVCVCERERENEVTSEFSVLPGTSGSSLILVLMPYCGGNLGKSLNLLSPTAELGLGPWASWVQARAGTCPAQPGAPGPVSLLYTGVQSIQFHQVPGDPFRKAYWRKPAWSRASHSGLRGPHHSPQMV